ncbi:MAG: HAMP domain-containing histidine kinase [Actinobacteria bacterium]|nr:HAMP domain-containing histidine kinase [Actinomycetota bacterium]MCA1721389.1 HAMP domain-containing histidine kinase [Actinomycetota bacterium]
MRSVPLRIKLVAALTVLVALALLVSGFAASAALRGYLMDRVDENLVRTVQLADRRGPARDDRPRLRRPDEYAVQLYAPDGTVARAFAAAAPVVPPGQVAARTGRPFTAGGAGRQWRVVVVPLGAGVVAVAADLSEVSRTLHRLALLELGIGAVVLLLFAGIGYGVVRTSLRPLVEVEETAEAIAAGDLTRRVPEDDPRTEVGRLARALNAMLGQIEHAFRSQQASETAARTSEERMRRFVADASHELRTPLTSIRGFAELYRQGAVPVGADLDRVMGRVEGEAARMGLLVEDLLLLARLDQQRPLQQEPVDLLVLATDAVHDAQAVAPDRTITLEVSAYDAPVVIGDDARLRQVFGNLLGNALTHTPDGTPVTVRVSTADRSAVVEVQDEGPGLPPDAAARAFERFYRADASRTRAQGGSGLGLSIVAALVEAHGGTVELDTAVGAGATFRVRLPLAA